MQLTLFFINIIQILISVTHIPPLLEYLTQPLPSRSQFKKISDAHTFALKTLIPSIDEAIKRLKIIEDETINKKEEDLPLLNLDLALVYGEDRIQNLINKKSRFLSAYTSDLILLKAWLQDVQGSLLYLSSYNLNGLHKMINVFRGHIVLGDAKKVLSGIRLKRNRLTNYEALNEARALYA